MTGDMHGYDDQTTGLDASADNTIREAFNDLNRRATMIPTDNGPHRATTPNFDRRPSRPAMAFAAVAALAVGTVGVLQLSGDDESTVNVAAENAETAETETQDDGVASEPNESEGDGQQAESDASDAATDDTTPTTDESDSAPDTNTNTNTNNDEDDDGDDGVTAVTGGDRFRVDTDRVAADSDPFLNVRGAPGIEGELLAKLPPKYRGLEATGQTEMVNGQTWVEVVLLHPVAFDGPVESAFRNPTGWLSGALIEPLTDGIAVGTDEVPACRGDQVLTESSNRGEFHVAGLESTIIADDCLRVVMTLAEGTAAFEWTEAAGAYGVPNISVIDNDFGAWIGLGDTGSVWPGATETTNGAYIMRNGDEENAEPGCPTSCLDLVVLRPAESVSTTMMPEIGAVVVDVKLASGSPHDPGALVHLLGEPQVEDDRVIVEGIARPFEATLGVEIVDANGETVTANYGGSSIGDIVGEQYGVNTTDWTSAWGSFIFWADGLAPGDYTLLLDGDGGRDNPDLVEVPFSISG